MPNNKYYHPFFYEHKVVPGPTEWTTTQVCKEDPEGWKLALADTDEDIEAGLEMCRTCPSLDICELWGWENRGEVVGVIGGYYHPIGFAAPGVGGLPEYNMAAGRKTRDLFWLEGRKLTRDAVSDYDPVTKKTTWRRKPTARDLGICEICNKGCAGKCDRINQLRVQQGYEPVR